MRLRRVELGRTVIFKLSNNNLIYLNLTQPNPRSNLCQLTRTCATYETEQVHEEARAQEDLKSGSIIRNDTITDTVISVSEITHISSNKFQNAMEDQKPKG
jgi:hypothetical protein